MNISTKSKVRNLLTKKSFILIAITFVLSFNLHAITLLNLVSRCFCTSCEGIPKTISLVKPIETYVIEGAGYFYEGFSEMMTLSNRYELMDLKGFNFDEANAILDRAITKVESARQSYSDLLMRTESMPYNQNAIDFLKRFNYAEYAYRNNVNRIIFDEVVRFLKRGDINGLNKNNYSKVSQIVEKLKLLRSDILQLKIPATYKIMEVNEMFSKSLITGQYSAAIFESIKDNN